MTEVGGDRMTDVAAPRPGERPGMWSRQGPYVLDWPDLGHALANLAGEVRTAAFAPTVVYAIARGGLVAAAYLTAVLDAGRMETVRVRRTEDDTQYAAKRRPALDRAGRAEPGPEDHVLVVDDIVGTGATAELVMRHLGELGVTEVRFAALVRNHLSPFLPDHCGFVVDDWVVFPWERGWHDRPPGWRPMPRPAARP